MWKVNFYKGKEWVNTASKHRIRVTSYPEGSHLYAWFDSRAEIIIIKALDPTKSTFAEPITLLDYSDESLQTTGVIDQFGNKECIHTYHTIDAVIDIGAVPGVFTKTSDTVSGPMVEVYKNSLNRLFTYFTVGKSLATSKGNYYIIDDSSSTSFSRRNFLKGGVHNNTYESKVVNIAYPQNLLDPWSVTLNRKQYYSAEVYSLPSWNWDTTSVETYKPIFIGTVGQIASRSDILRTISAQFNLKSRLHFVPDNILDDVFERMTIPDVNNVENLKDLKRIRESLPPVVDLLKKRNFKSLADLYLWYKYTYKTTELDLKAYYNFFRKWLKSSKEVSNVKRIHLKYTTSIKDNSVSEEVVTRYQIYHEPYNVGVLRTLGLEINLGNTWDLLPFSFVVDWFINIGDILQRLDHNSVISEMKIRSVMTSTKHTYRSQPLTAFACRSYCYGNYYRRSVDRSLPLGKLEVSLKNPGAHLLDGTALIIARK